MKKYLILPIVFLLSVSAQAQQKINNAYFNNLSPKTPVPSSLGSFGNIPVNYFTGLPEVNLELFRLTSRALELPISLAYDASGVHVDDLSGPVGIKWNLNAGGSITRKLNGSIPDEHPTLGYWKNSLETDYFANLSDPQAWVNASEAKTNDCEPDEFVIDIPGRTIKFVFDKYRRAMPVPRQNVKIKFTVTSDKITQFELVVEDGTKYIFGGATTSIQETKIENLTVQTSFAPDPPGVMEVYEQYPANSSYERDGNTDIFYKGGEKFHYDYTNNLKIIDFYNSKWYLLSIQSPDGDMITFNYAKGTDLQYVMKPSTLRVGPVWTPVETYSYVQYHCEHPAPKPIGCIVPGTYKDITVTNFRAPVKFARTDPGSAPGTTNEYLKPDDFFATAGGVNSYHTKITESQIKLLSIQAQNGNNVIFETTSRTDLPNSEKYETIKLLSMNGLIVKSLKLNYSTTTSIDDSNDYLWLGEAMMCRKIDALLNGSQLFAYHVRNAVTNPSQVTDATLRTYVYEGIKAYNYQRLFLESVDDLTGNSSSNSQVIQLYKFTYKDRNLLRRRTTTMHDAAGLTTTTGAPETWACCGGTSPQYVANMSNAYNISFGTRAPLSGTLQSIKYPTGGSTDFTYEVTTNGFRLLGIKDLLEAGNVAAQKEIEYMSSTSNESYVFTSYLDLNAMDNDGNARPNDWMKYKIDSSTPQNDPSLTNGVIATNWDVKVYNGTKSNYIGYERFVFHSPSNTQLAELATEIKSIPNDEANLDGRKLCNIFPFPRNQDDYTKGLLKQHQVFKNGSNVPVKETFYYYIVNPNQYTPATVFGFKGGKFVYKAWEEVHFFMGHESNASERFRYGRRKISADWVVLDYQKELITDQTDKTKRIAKITEFEYDPTCLQLVESKSYLEGSPSSAAITKTRYATNAAFEYSRPCTDELSACKTRCDYLSTNIPECYRQCDDAYQSCMGDHGDANTSAIYQMKLNNQINLPIETQQWVQEGAKVVLTSAVVYKYENVGSNKIPKPKEVWELNQTLNANDYAESRVNSGQFQIDTKMRKAHSFDSYDLTSLNLLQQTTLDGISSTYTWGYGNSLVTAQTSNPGPSEQMTSYSHVPMVGLDKVTDPNGIISYFEYDPNYRILRERDHDYNIIKRYRYHYNGADENLTASFTFSGQRTTNSVIMFTANRDTRPIGEVTYTWDFGNGDILSGNSTTVEYRYPQSGSFTVKLTKYNPEYGKVSATSAITISPPIVASICASGPQKIIRTSSSNPYMIIKGECTPSGVTVDQNSSTTLKFSSLSGGCSSTYTYKWETKIGVNGSWTTFATVKEPNPPVGFINRTNGNYYIRCLLTDSCGNTTLSNELDLAIQIQ